MLISFFEHDDFDFNVTSEVLPDPRGILPGTCKKGLSLRPSMGIVNPLSEIEPAVDPVLLGSTMGQQHRCSPKGDAALWKKPSMRRKR